MQENSLKPQKKSIISDDNITIRLWGRLQSKAVETSTISCFLACTAQCTSLKHFVSIKMQSPWLESYQWFSGQQRSTITPVPLKWTVKQHSLSSPAYWGWYIAEILSLFWCSNACCRQMKTAIWKQQLPSSRELKLNVQKLDKDWTNPRFHL